MNKLSSFFARFVEIPYQAACMLITTLLIFAFLYRPLTHFTPLEIQPNLLPVTEEVIKKWGKIPAVTKTGFAITDILKFDLTKNDIVLTAIVWFEFDPKLVTKESIEKFSFIKMKTLQKFGDFYMLDDKKTMRAFYYVTLEVNEAFDFHRFPLDNHIITFRLVNEDRGPDELIFTADLNDFVYMQEILLPGWKLFEYKVTSGYRTWPFSKVDSENFEEQTMANFELGLSKHDMRQILLIVLPLLIIFFLGLFSLSLVQDYNGLSLTSVSGLIGYTFVLQNISPNVSYFMVSDYFLLLLFSCSLIIFIFNFLFSEKSTFTEENRRIYKGALVLCLHIVILVSWFYLTNFYYY